MGRMLRTIAGLVLIVVGIAGLVLPIIPGIPILIAGMALLSADHPLRVVMTRHLRRWGVMKTPSDSPPEEDKR